jgi:hypothetical protein
LKYAREAEKKRGGTPKLAKRGGRTGGEEGGEKGEKWTCRKMKDVVKLKFCSRYSFAL